MTPVRSVTGTTVHTPGDWSLRCVPSGSCAAPADLPDGGWLPAVVPGTVALAASCWPARDHDTMAAAVRAADEFDWWYRCTFDHPGRTLRVGGLATVAEVWLNGRRVLASENMFLPRELDIGGARRAGRNELVLCFRALTGFLATRRPRPRWRTGLLVHQQLRWLRTSLLGRMRGWSSHSPMVGPWRELSIVDSTLAELADVGVTTRVEGTRGLVDVALDLVLSGRRRLAAATVRVGAHTQVMAARNGRLTGRIAVPDAQWWWPHTHGGQPLYPVGVRLELVGGGRVDIDLGSVGFREVTMAGDPEDFALRINGSEVFLRGACWTPTETGAGAQLRMLRDSGANLVRVCGPMTYEPDSFYQECDRLGLAVWQDFMFANMDYPVDDPEFHRAVTEEARAVLTGLGGHPCVTVLCGGSEVAQQAAFAGRPPEEWINPWFGAELPKLCRQSLPGVPYWPSSPYGGVLPVHPDRGDAHYYGIGAYLRDFDDVFASGTRFASECAAFANVPEPANLARLFGADTATVTDPRWKQGSPRDHAAGWDFDDVRDHYLAKLFGVDPVALRHRDIGRYVELSRVTTGEVMARLFAAWQSRWTPCGGGLVWFWRDLAPGAGWGVVDSDQAPKAAYYYLRRAWRPRNVRFVDRSLNGLWLVISNDRPSQLDAVLRISGYPSGSATAVRVLRPVKVAAGGREHLSADELLGGFQDLNQAYRFGPPGCEALLAELLDAELDTVIADDHHFPAGMSSAAGPEPRVTAVAAHDGDDCLVTVSARQLATAVRLEVVGYRPEDNYFHLVAGATRTVRLRPVGTPPGRFGRAKALNSLTEVRFTLPEHKEPA